MPPTDTNANLTPYQRRMLYVAEQLQALLRAWQRERREEQKKQISALHVELCSIHPEEPQQ